jgi:hypothetical protein
MGYAMEVTDGPHCRETDRSIPVSTKGAFGQKRTSKITESGRSMALSTPS